jgi:hypothetical protein
MVSGAVISMVFAKRHFRFGSCIVFGITTVPTKMVWVIHVAGAVPLHVMVSMVLVCMVLVRMVLVRMVLLRDCRSSASF